jgi:hypothetical protein
MDSTFTLFSVAAGLLLSIACAALLEELIFGGIFRLFFAPRPVNSANNTHAIPMQAKEACMGHQQK